MPDSGPFTLNADQLESLQAASAAWEEDEGEERLERLREREEDTETLRLIAQLLAQTDFAHSGRLPRPQLIRLLALFRALAPNPNLDARLLNRPGEPEAFNRDLHDLLYGPTSMPLRLRQFITRRHAGRQTALQLLCAVYPHEWPLVTQSGIRSLAITAEQNRLAVQTARGRFDLPAEVRAGEASAPARNTTGLPDTDSVVRLLADVVIYDAVRAVIDAPDYLVVHRLLTGTSSGGSKRRRSSAMRYLSPQSRPGHAAEDLPPTLPADLLSAIASVREPERPDYVPQAPPNTDNIRTADLLSILEAEIAERGFSYPPLVVRDYFLCLQSKPYVWLLGANGIGKTRLTSLFAETLTGNLAEQYRLIPVRPDWGDSAPLLGYVNLLAGGGEGRYVITPFLEFLLRVARPDNATRAHFLCLDEMNLARVEHYFAEVLSAMETPTRDLLLPNGGVLRLPSNLFITGTLNTDEATFVLSRKVLDRANTISLRTVSLKGAGAPPAASRPTIDPAIRQAVFLQRRVTMPDSARTRLKQVSNEDLAAWVVDRLVEVNALLEPYELQFAYRVRDEALCYCANSFDLDGGGLLTPDAPQDVHANITIALDFQLLQKVLPRLSGTQDQVEPLLNALLRWAENGHFVRTAQKLRGLLARLQRDGFVSFE